MPRYVKQGRKDGSFRRKFPKHTAAQAQSFLARLSKEEFETVKHVAHHFQGNTNHFSPHLPKHASKKIKPSSYKYITNARNPYDLGRALQVEQVAHKQPHTETHLGGGLLEAFNSVGNYMWELYNPLPEPVKWAIDKYKHRDQSRKMTKQDRNNADLLTVAYKDQANREGEMDGFTRIPKYDTEYSTVWQGPDGNLSVAIRGSKSFTDWMYHDPKILMEGKPGESESESIQQYLIHIAKDNPDAELTVNSHSLSGSFVQNAFTQATPEEAEWLDHYDRLNMYNPGASPFVGTDDIKEFTEDPRVHLYLNRTDLISSAYNSVLPENYDRVTYGNPSYDPTEAHGVSQWGNQQPEEPAPEKPQEEGGFWSGVGEVVSAIGEVFHAANFAPDL